ncbi:hypothetical protein PV08_03949 [Exophiala spinifera]|uniref:Uncharacterized protein n=1 Tax=Exophiala spinifera TaxID=91928 RepID=A0A0D2BZJ3_9EURO|nr:uncharacterized protein PV08_03949 [Exophiala spinifera]KIW16759.1 hypothetical protein PV08_03949 [Exophiala spinifera]
MLRRKPTALTITSEDIAAFEEQLARKVAYARYLKTGEDPEGYFRNGTAGHQHRQPGHDHDHDAQMQMGGGARRDASSNATGGTIDPNDELKPLPGDKARIVRSREDRIMGMGNPR